MLKSRWPSESIFSILIGYAKYPLLVFLSKVKRDQGNTILLKCLVFHTIFYIDSQSMILFITRR